jgi:hypothetical protein
VRKEASDIAGDSTLDDRSGRTAVLKDLLEVSCLDVEKDGQTDLIPGTGTFDGIVSKMHLTMRPHSRHILTVYRTGSTKE